MLLLCVDPLVYPVLDVLLLHAFGGQLPGLGCIALLLEVLGEFLLHLLHAGCELPGGGLLDEGEGKEEAHDCFLGSVPETCVGDCVLTSSLFLGRKARTRFALRSIQIRITA